MEWVRKATGSAVVIVNGRGEVLVLRRSYPPFDWVLPGGNAEVGESPVETALRIPKRSRSTASSRRVASRSR